MLENNNDMCNHHRKIQVLLTEVFKMKNELAPLIMESISNKRFNTYNLRNFQEFAAERKRPVWYGLESLSFIVKTLDFYNVKSYTFFKLANLCLLGNH